MSEVSPTQTHDGMGALHAGNTVESLRPRQGIEMNKDGPPLSQYFEDISQNPHINEQLADQGLKLNLPEPISVEFTAGVAVPSPADPLGLGDVDNETLLFRTVVQLFNLLEGLQKRVAALESRIDDHNVRGSHKI